MRGDAVSAPRYELSLIGTRKSATPENSELDCRADFQAYNAETGQSSRVSIETEGVDADDLLIEIVSLFVAYSRGGVS